MSGRKKTHLSTKAITREDIDSLMSRIIEAQEHEARSCLEILTYIPCRITLQCITIIRNVKSSISLTQNNELCLS